MFPLARVIVIYVVHFIDLVESAYKTVWDLEDLKTKQRGILSEQNFKSDIVDLGVLNNKGKCTLDCIRQDRQMSQQGEKSHLKLMTAVY